MQLGPDQPCINKAFLLDNADNLSSSGLKKLSDTLVILKKKASFAKIAIVLTSNRDIRLVVPALDNSVVAPAWNQRELKELLRINDIPDDQEYPDKYLELLEIKSGGHPALALALARKYPTSSGLLQSMISKQGLEDADLNQEVKSLLYQELLIDADYQNFVHRLSLLVYPAIPIVIERICYDVTPVISTPPKVMLDRLGQAIIEGEEQTGFYVSHIFKEVAKQQIGLGQQQQVYKQVSEVLLRIKDKVIDVKHFTEGILYAVLGLELSRAFVSTAFLLTNLLRKKTDTEHLRHVLQRIDLVTLVKPPLDAQTLLQYAIVVFASALGYSRLKEHKRAAEMLSRFDLSQKVESDGELESELKFIRHAISWFRLIEFCYAREYRRAVETLATIDVDESEEIIRTKFGTPPVGLEIGAELLTLVPLDEIPKALVSNLLSRTTISDIQLSSLLTSGFSVGAKAARDGKTLESIATVFAAESTLSALLQKMALAAYYLEVNDTPNALAALSEAQARLLESKLDGPLAAGKILQAKADALYIRGELTEASKYYKQQLELISDNSSFDYGWGQYRIGLSEENAALAEPRFAAAGKAFAALGLFDLLARCEGEHAVALWQLGRKEEFATLLDWLFTEYFENGKEEFGPSCTMAAALIQRLLAELENQPMPSIPGLSFPELKRRSYQFGSSQIKPTAGIVTIFFQLGKLYGLFGLKDKEVDTLRRGLAKPSENQVDQEIIPMVAKTYLDRTLGDHSAVDTVHVMKRIIDCQTSMIHVASSLAFLSWCVFSKFDELSAGTSGERSKVFTEVLTNLETYCQSDNFLNGGFWLAAIYLRKALLKPGSRTREEQAHFWNRAYGRALSDKNYEVTMHSAHALSFEFAEFVHSLKALGDLNINFVKAVEAQGMPPEYFASFGRNLFKFWSSIDFKHLSERDFKVKHALLDGAKSLKKAGLPAENAGPLMLLLLASAYEHDGAATEWALEKVKSSINRLPSDVAGHLAKLLNQTSNCKDIPHL